MTQEIIARFKALFEEQRSRISHAHMMRDGSLILHKEDLMDEADLTSAEMASTMRMRLMNREALFAKKIDEALERISQGIFGECECCEEDIELRRLEARPTATLCVTCKEESERMECVHIDGHRSKSLGYKLQLA